MNKTSRLFETRKIHPGCQILNIKFNLRILSGVFESALIAARQLKFHALTFFGSLSFRLADWLWVEGQSILGGRLLVRAAFEVRWQLDLNFIWRSLSGIILLLIWLLCWIAVLNVVHLLINEESTLKFVTLNFDLTMLPRLSVLCKGVSRYGSICFPLGLGTLIHLLVATSFKSIWLIWNEPWKSRQRLSSEVVEITRWWRIVETGCVAQPFSVGSSRFGSLVHRHILLCPSRGVCKGT